MKEVKMGQCCRCNKTGRCMNCACVKAGNLCQSCLPSRLGQCTNSQPVTLSPTATVNLSANPQTSNPAQVPLPNGPQTDSSPALATQEQLQTTTVPTTIIPSWGELPAHNIMAKPIFSWGSSCPESLSKSLTIAYKEIVHWKPNLFKMPQGNTGKTLVAELTRLYNAFATGSALESVAMAAVTILPSLLLQKPARNSKNIDHIRCIERRLPLWRDGQIDELLAEGRTLQNRLSKLSSKLSSKSNYAAKDPDARLFCK